MRYLSNAQMKGELFQWDIPKPSTLCKNAPWKYVLEKYILEIEAWKLMITAFGIYDVAWSINALQWSRDRVEI